MTAILLSDTVWEGLGAEMTDSLPALRDGHFYKQLDTGESYFRREGAWEFVNLGLAFIKATKSGRAITDGDGLASVTFNTPFIDTEYSIALSCLDNGIQPVIAFESNRGVAGFAIVTRSARTGQPTPSIEVSWLCTRDYNP